MRLAVVSFVASLLLAGTLPAVAADADTASLLKALQSADEPARIQAIHDLAESGAADEQVVTALAGQLKDGSAPVRAHAAQALGKIGPAAKSAVTALAPLVTDADDSVRREAIRAIIKTRPALEVVQPLLKKIMDDATPEVRMEAMHAMAEVGKPVVPQLIEAIKVPGAGFYACIVLAEIGPDAAEAVAALTDKVKTEKRPEIRREAISALGAIGASAAPAVPTLAEALGDESGAVQLSAAFALGRIGPPAKSASPALIKALKSSDTMLQVVSTWALLKVGYDDAAWKDKAIGWLAGLLTSKNALVRSAAFRALADLRPGPERILPAIEQVLGKADKQTARDAIAALAGFGEPAVPALVNALKLAEHRAVIASILAEMGPSAKAAVPALVDIVKTDKRSSVRRESLIALGAIAPGAPEVVAAAAAALNDPDERSGRAACYVLGSAGPAASSAEGELTKKLDGDDPALAIASAWALVKIQPNRPQLAPKLVPLLVKGFEFDEPMFRAGAASALGDLGPLAKDAAPVLKKASTDPDERIRTLATEALKKVGG
jgi:HEAT repeat protein